MKKGTAYIGTSGWSYEHWFNGVYYPADLSKARAFDYYQSKFNTVELNVTFYRLLKKSTFEAWLKRSRQDFIFSIKGSRYITHTKRLKNVQEGLDNFFERISGLGNKVGPILWQLPTNFNKSIIKLENFLAILPDKYKHVFEFRNEDWFDQKIYKLLEKYNAAFTISHSSNWPLVKVITADFCYIRLHGGRKLYESNYSKEELEKWTKLINKYLNQGIDVYAYFNNDYKGYAPKNAAKLIMALNANQA